MYGLILPVRVISRPLIVEETSTPAIIGMVSRPGLGRGVAAADLEVLAEEDGAAEHRHADREAGDDRQGGRALADDVQRHDRLGGPRLDPDGERQRAATPAPTMAAVCQDSQANELSTNDTQMSSTLTPAAIRVAPR